MPQIFQKDSKVNVIEYGEHICSSKDLTDMTNNVVTFMKKLISQKQS